MQGLSPRSLLTGIGPAWSLSVEVVFDPRPASVPGRLLEAPALVRLGLVSYGVYLWHEPLVHWLLDAGHVSGSGTGSFAVAVGLVGTSALALATATYLLVEAPVLRRKRVAAPVAPSDGSGLAPAVPGATTPEPEPQRPDPARSGRRRLTRRMRGCSRPNARVTSEGRGGMYRLDGVPWHGAIAPRRTPPTRRP